jgi:pimeloyl-ACP methyl ester carboxylesterase
MRPSIEAKLIAPAIILGLSLVLGYSNPSRRLCADESPAHSREKTLSGENNQDQGNEAKAASASRFNLAIKTGGGTQLWTDYCYREGFRVQRNAMTGHWRLLDPNDVRKGWGSREQCMAMLDQLQPKSDETAAPKHFVVLLHGLMRTHHSMKPIANRLAEEGHSDVIRFSYASTRSSIADHSQALREVLEDLPANTQFSFVGHSMGNIVVRHLIGRLQEDDPKHLLDRCHAMVMLGPPNQGAAISRRLAPTGVFGWITGQGGLELGPQWDRFVEELAIPPFPFLIIAGDLSGLPITNPLVDGSSDFVVSVEEAALEGAQGLETVPVLHSFLMNDTTAVDMTLKFLREHGLSP